MAAQPWRERREAYLRDRGRLTDLIREGYVQAGLAVIEGGDRRVSSNHPPLRIITVQNNPQAPSGRAETPVGEPAA